MPFAWEGKDYHTSHVLSHTGMAPVNCLTNVWFTADLLVSVVGSHVYSWPQNVITF